MSCAEHAMHWWDWALVVVIGGPMLLFVLATMHRPPPGYQAPPQRNPTAPE